MDTAASFQPGYAPWAPPQYSSYPPGNDFSAPAPFYPSQQGQLPFFVPPTPGLAELRSEVMQALAYSRVDAGELILPIRLLGDPRNNDEKVWTHAVQFTHTFLAPPRVLLYIGSIIAQGSGDHGQPPTEHGNLDRLLVKMTALDVSTTGFTFDLRTWHRGHIMKNSTFVWMASCNPTWACTASPNADDPSSAGRSAAARPPPGCTVA